MRQRRTRNRSRERAAFTLMEVLLVLVILVVLGSFAVGVFSNTQARALVRAAQSQIGLFKTPLNTYQLDVGMYPSTLEALYSVPSDLTNPTKWGGPYLETIPLDPWGNPYQYQFPGNNNPNSYDVWSFGPDGQNGTADDIGNWLVVQ